MFHASLPFLAGLLATLGALGLQLHHCLLHPMAFFLVCSCVSSLGLLIKTPVIGFRAYLNLEWPHLN